MTRDKASKILPLLSAYVSGSDIQYRLNGEGEWVTSEWEFNGQPEDYRVKPKPREFLVSLKDGAVVGCGYALVDGPGIDIIKVREVLYGE